ncbi:uncharacterized protein LOC143620925 [Bidens hawaiensis]|uniref:uncharacterized protein LOC143620925 n=1 Tax=Bidens hawaiensis TaxID=980011 RepID=UPI004049DB5E
MAIDFYILHLLLLPPSHDNVFLSFSSVIAGAILKGGGVELLLGLATSLKEGIQKEATKTTANLLVDPAFAISMNRWVAGEAATEIWNLSASDEHQGAIVESGAIKALVDTGTSLDLVSHAHWQPMMSVA